MPGKGPPDTTYTMTNAEGKNQKKKKKKSMGLLWFGTRTILEGG